MSAQWDELLRQDQEVTERVFAAMEARFASEAGPSPAQVMRLVRYLNDYVDRCHNRKEERTVFPLLERAGMQVRYVEEPDQLRQALLEIYTAIVVLGTPFNDFDTH